jgi:hypothetical protein
VIVLKFSPFTEKHYQKVLPGLLLYNEKKFWECHEVLEDVWLEDVGDGVRYIPWAIIQCAASMYHYDAENQVGMFSMLKKAREKFIFIQDHKLLNSDFREKMNWNQFEGLVFHENESWKDYLSLRNFEFPIS